MSTEVGSLIQKGQASILEDLAFAQIRTTSDPAAESGGSSFLSTMKDALHHVDGEQRSAAEQMAAVDSGASDDLVGAMLSSQQASLSFSMLMQVRNKVVAAVDDLVKLPL